MTVGIKLTAEAWPVVEKWIEQKALNKVFRFSGVISSQCKAYNCIITSASLLLAGLSSSGLLVNEYRFVCITLHLINLNILALGSGIHDGNVSSYWCLGAQHQNGIHIVGYKIDWKFVWFKNWTLMARFWSWWGISELTLERRTLWWQRMASH